MFKEKYYSDSRIRIKFIARYVYTYKELALMSGEQMNINIQENKLQ